MKVLFLASSRKGKGVSPFIKSQLDSLVHLGIKIDLLLVPGSGLKHYLKTILLLRKKCKTENYNLVHAHYGFCGLLALLSFIKIPKIVSFMGDDLLGTPNFKGKYKPINSLYVFVNICTSFFYKSIIVKSAEMRDKLLIKKNVYIIPNGVDFNLFYPVDQLLARKELKILNSKSIILFAGSPKYARKNFALAKETMKYLNSKNIELIVLENIPHEKVFLYYNAVNVLLLLSLHEGSPNVIKEAMACNCPIVATDVGDIKEIIGDTEGCYICTTNPQIVAEKINQALTFGRRTNGREMIGYLKSGVIANRIIKLYENTLN